MSEELENKIPVREYLKQIITPQETLDKRIFDEDGIMYADLRDRILLRANFMAKKTISEIDGFEYNDVWLIGSSATYFYKESSDLDISVIVKNKDCFFLPQKYENLRVFISYLSSSFHTKYGSFFIDDRFMDLKLRINKDNLFCGVYSVLKNEWVVNPSKDIYNNIDLDDIIKKYFLKCEELDIFLNKIKYNANDVAPLEDVEKINLKFQEEMRNSGNSIDNFLVFKLTKELLKKMLTTYKKDIAASLSLEVEL